MEPYDSIGERRGFGADGGDQNGAAALCLHSVLGDRATCAGLPNCHLPGVPISRNAIAVALFSCGARSASADIVIGCATTTPDITCCCHAPRATKAAAYADIPTRRTTRRPIIWTTRPAIRRTAIDATARRCDRTKWSSFTRRRPPGKADAVHFLHTSRIRRDVSTSSCFH